jgi:tripartite-type tricarboxylate transporter receptor subunit TctC
MRTVKLSRRQCLVTVGGVLTALAAAPAAAQTFPTHPLRLIVPFPAGGSNDVMARLIAPHLEQSLGQPVIVDNRPAAAGQVGTDAVAKSPPDGHTLLLVASSHTVTPALNPKLPYNTEKDFAPISLINTNAMVFLVHPGVPANTLTEFVALAKKEPGKFNYASPGVGSQTQLTIELLSRRTGIKLVHIPYRGGAPATLAMISGESQFTMLAPNVLFPHIESGKLRAIATGSPARHPRLPTVPTTAELGMPNLKAIQWVGNAEAGC